MKLRRILAASAAAVVAASAMSVASFAATTYWVENGANTSGRVASYRTDDGTTALLENQDLVTTITKVDIVATTDLFDDFVDAYEGGEWFGGAFIINSNSTGWKQYAYNSAEPGDVVITIDKDAELITITYDNGAPFYAASDTYCLVHHHDYTTNSYDMKVVDVIPYNAEGVDVRTLDGAAATTPDEPVVDEPVDDETPSVIAPAPDDTVDEPIAEEPIADEPADEPADGAADAVVDTDNTTETGKDSVDTGVEGIAAVAGVVALAGVAVVASRKRK